MGENTLIEMCREENSTFALALKGLALEPLSDKNINKMIELAQKIRRNKELIEYLEKQDNEKYNMEKKNVN